jgi:cation transport ATPase
MPEEVELENEIERIKELIEEGHAEEQRTGGLLRRISLSTAFIAVVAAIAALEAGSTVNEALLEKNTAMATRTEAFDLWAQYQAKGIKGAILESETRLREVVAPGQPSSEGETTRSASMRQEIVRHQAEQEEIAREAHAREKKAKQHAEVAEHLTHRHHRYAFSVALLQIAIALSAIAALGRSRPMWWLSLLTAGVGTLIFLDGFLLLV